MQKYTLFAAYPLYVVNKRQLPSRNNISFYRVDNISFALFSLSMMRITFSASMRSCPLNPSRSICHSNSWQFFNASVTAFLAVFASL